MDVVLLVLVAVAIVTAALARRAAARALVSEGEALAPHWTATEVLGKTVAQAFPEDRIEEALPSIKAALAGERGSLEWLGVRSGEMFRVDLVPFRETGEAVTHVMLAIRNIQEEKALQHSLVEQSGFL